MTALTTARRKALPGSDFAGPDRSYPIDTEARARSALARAAANDPHLLPSLRRKIHARYPDMEIEGLAKTWQDHLRQGMAQRGKKG